MSPLSFWGIGVNGGKMFPRQKRTFVSMKLLFLCLCSILFHKHSQAKEPQKNQFATAFDFDDFLPLGNAEGAFDFAFGDVDGDGDLDVALAHYNNTTGVEENKVYANDGAGNFGDSPLWEASVGDETIGVAFGDMDSDGDLDLFFGNGNSGKKNLYLNDGTGNFGGSPAWQSPDSKYSLDLDIGDLDGDGDLDVAVAHLTDPVQVYINQGGAQAGTIGTFSIQDISGALNVVEIEIADLDGDDDLDIVAAVSAGNDIIYLNQGGQQGGSAGTFSAQTLSLSSNAASLAVGDVNGDGENDLIFAGTANAQLYLYQSSAMTVTYTATAATAISSLANQDIDLGDADGDGDLDLGISLGLVNAIYINDGTGDFGTSPVWEASNSFASLQVKWGDVDNDGDLDLGASFQTFGLNKVFLNPGNLFGPIAHWDTGGGVQRSTDIVFGDVDGDNDLDALVAWGLTGGFTNKLHINDGTGNFTVQNLNTAGEHTNSILAADVDGDGDLDAIHGNSSNPSSVYANDGNGVFSNTALWSSPTSPPTYDIAVGDVDGDGDLDLAMGNLGQANQIFLNDGNGDFGISPAWESSDSKYTQSLTLSDLDGDGDLDLAVGNEGGGLPPAGEVNQVFLNDGSGNFGMTAHWESTGNAKVTRSIEPADVDGDGDVDLIAGNEAQFTRVYLNDGNANFTQGWVNSDAPPTLDIAVDDIDGDGDQDFVMGNVSAPNQMYVNDGTGNFTRAWESSDALLTIGVALGDVDNDGDFDLGVANRFISVIHPNQIFLNSRQGMGIDSAYPTIGWATNDGYGNDHAIATIADSQIIPLPYALIDQSGKTTGGISVTFSLDGGDNWQPAVPESGTVTNHLTPRPFASQGGVDLDGVNDYVDLPDMTPDISGGFTVEAWVYYENFNNWSRIIELNNNGLNNSIELMNLGTTSDLYMFIRPSGTDIQAVGVLELNKWIHVAGTVDGAGNATLYKNGMVVATDIVTLPGNVTRTDNFIGDSSFFSSNFAGKIDEVRFWDVTRSQAQIQANMFRELNGGEANLQGYWTFAEGVGTTTADRSANNLDGTLTNGTEWDSFYRWDTFASGVFGQSDDVVVRMEAKAQTANSATVGTYLYVNGNAGTFQRPATSAHTYPFRLRGTQVQVLHTTPVGHWAFEEGGGTVAEDSSGNGNAGTFTSTPTYSTDVPTTTFSNDYALNFDGINDQITIPDSPELDLNSLSIGGWIKPTGNGTDWQPIIVKEDSNGATRNYGLYLYPPPNTSTLFFSMSHSNCTSYSNLTANTQLPLNEWSHVMATYDGAEMKLYINGVLDNSIATVTTLCQSNHPVKIGGEVNVFDNFEGALDDIRIYDTALSVGEVGGLASGQSYGLDGGIVYQLSSGQTSGATAIGNNAGVPATTDPQGFLQGRGEINLGDSLYALYPVNTTDSYVLYHTSGIPNPTGVTGTVVSQAGVQQLTVSADNPLLLFNLDISLEWDARNDDTFLIDLQNNIQQASTILFDITNGQAALGKVHIYQAKENWMTSDVVIHAANDIRPRATQGGIVPVSTSDIGLTGVITDAFVPGQVTMGPIWDPFGENQLDLGQEWYRALAHELGHFLFYLPDNYLGFDGQGQLIGIDCFGSFMTNTSDDDYSEFLTAAGFAADPDCTDTVAMQTTGRADWETVTHFYPFLSGSTSNPGPSLLPLQLIDFHVINPINPVGTQAVRNYDLRDATTNELVTLPQADGYLRKSFGTPDLTDDLIVGLGGSRGGGDRLKVRGAEPGDQVCVNDTSEGVTSFGCVDVTLLTSVISMEPVPGWLPTLSVQPVTSRTLAITVTQSIPGGVVNAQVLPAYGDPENPNQRTSPFSTMTPVSGANITFTTQITLDAPSFNGFVRVWVPGSSPQREIVSEYLLNVDLWGGNTRPWGGGNTRPWGGGNTRPWGGGNTRAWGGGNTRAWGGTPTVSGDGQFTVINSEEPYGETGISSVQELTSLFDLPDWLTMVGNAYEATQGIYTGTAPIRSVTFDYLQRDVPDGYEYTLNIYYQAPNSTVWERLETSLDTDENRAAATLPPGGTGRYVLVATLEMPALIQGWNQFAFTIPNTRTVTATLASIQEDYTTVYHYDPAADAWTIYDQPVVAEYPDFVPLVNTLGYMEFGHSYWIYAITDTVPYVGVPENGFGAPMSGLQLPPETFYGWITATAGIFTPTVGMPVQAYIDGNLCGSTTIQSHMGLLAYTMQVRGENVLGTPNGCGANGRTIVFKVGDWYMAQDKLWGNEQAWFYPLQTIQPPPLAPANMATDLTGGTFTISWSAVLGANHYEVWRSETPYFTVGGVGSVKIAEPTSPLVVDNAGIGNTTTNYFYFIIAVDEHGQKSPLSSHVGEFDFGIAPGN